MHEINRQRRSKEKYTMYQFHLRVSTDPGNPGYPGKTLEFKRIMEFLEKPWNSVENPGKITLKSIFVDICRHLSIFCGLGRQDL